jgi:hypothetical protein
MSVLCVAVLVFHWSIQAVTAEEPPITLEKLRQELEKREAALKAFSVTVDIMGQLFTGDRSSSLAKETWTIDGDPTSQEKPGCRVRKQRQVRRTTPDGKTSESRSLAVYDGREMRSLNGSVDGRWRRGRASKHWWEAFRGSGAEPRGFLTHYDYEPCSHFVSKNPTRIVGHADWKGRSVVQIESGPFPWKENGWSGKVQLLIDPKRGFALVRQSTLVQCGPGEPWHEYVVRDTEDFVEASPGIWVPTRATYWWGGAGRNPKPSSREELRFTQWDPKPDVSDSVFQLDFRPGLVVTDE